MEAQYKGRALLIAIDFDGTCVEHAFPHVGKTMPGAVETIRDLKEAGHRILMWTCREDFSTHKYLTQAKRWALKNGIDFHGHNEDPQNPFLELGGEAKQHQRKIYADLYIDDRNLGGFPGWDAVRKAVLS